MLSSPTGSKIATSFWVSMARATTGSLRFHIRVFRKILLVHKTSCINMRFHKCFFWGSRIWGFYVLGVRTCKFWALGRLESSVLQIV